MECRRTLRWRGYNGCCSASYVRGFSIPDSWLRRQTGASAPWWSGLLRNLVPEVNTIEEIVILEKLIPLWVVLENLRPRTLGPGSPRYTVVLVGVRPRTLRPGSSWCAKHRIDRPAASVTGSGPMVREPGRRKRAFRRGQPICCLSRPQGCKSLLCTPLDLAAAPFPFQLTKGHSMFRARERDGSRQRMGRRSRGCPTRVTSAGAAGRCLPYAVVRTVAKNVTTLDGGRACVATGGARDPPCIRARRIWHLGSGAAGTRPGRREGQRV